MLKLLLFVPCERVIVGEDGLTSVIALLENVNVDVQKNLPADAAIPFKWSVVTMWQRMEGTDEGAYQQRIEVHAPNGNSIGAGEVEFIVSDQHLNYRNIVNLNAFPIGQQGKCLIKLHLKKTSSDEWHLVNEYTVMVVYQQSKTAPEAGENLNTPE